MRLSRSFGKTLREAPASAEMASHKFLLRANYVRPLGAGIYTFMPLGYRVMKKVWRILSEEMNRIGGQEMLMPNMHPASAWEATKRWDTFGPVLLKISAGGGRDYALSPTHEEVVTDLARREIESYRDLPQFIYHISKKFRDEQRARGGLIRLREFIMKDAYTLDTDEEALDRFYPEILQAYMNIFTRCGLDARQINADVGAMGGKSSHEFIMTHPQGEDIFIACSNCDYAANVEAAEFVREGATVAVLADLVKIETPDCSTIADVADFVGVGVEKTLKAVFYWHIPVGTAASQGRIVFAVVRGDLEINEVKLGNALGPGTLRAATDEEITSVGAAPGYASPASLDVAGSLDGDGLAVVGDLSIEAGGNFVVGANEDGFHFTGANYPRDFTVSVLADIAQADSGHKCPLCGGRIEAQRGIELGHCFKLGTRYSAAADVTYLDANNDPQHIYMGSYGIGVDRLIAAIVERHHDEHGIVWPRQIAPYDVHLLHLGKAEEVSTAAADLYAELTSSGFEVLYDDRNVSAGVKFKDADLIGVPVRVAVSSRGLGQGGFEVKMRDSDERTVVESGDLVSYLNEKLA